ncbi:MAG TPA: type II secretion system protein [Gallionella sp.]
MARTECTALRRGRGGAGGFTYIGLLAVIAIITVAMAATGEVWHTSQRREQERQLLFVGDQFRQAIGRYYEHTPGQQRRYPQSLTDLLKDPRYPSTQRYLRRIYTDPVGGGDNWGVVRGPDGEIYGVYSLSEAEPLKKGNFRMADRNFEGKTKYADWVFMHIPGQRSTGASPRP